MADKTWTLTDLAAGKYEEQLAVTSNDVPGAPDGWSVNKRTLRGGLSDGVDVIQVDNGTFSFVVIPTRGMGLWKGWLGEMEVGWQSPNRGPAHPKFVPLSEPSGLGWLDGFDEWLVRCGLESNGAPDFDDNGRLAYPLHGRIANKPAQFVELHIDGESGEITIAGVVEETRFHFSKLRMTTTIKTKPGEAGVRIQDKVENIAGVEGGMQMLYHVNFGAPLLDAGAKFVAPVKTVVPRNAHAAQGIAGWDNYSGEQPGFEEQVYFLELAAAGNGSTQTLLKNAHGTAGVTMRFNKQKLPCFTVWKNPAASQDGYVTGLEPGTNFPNPRSFEAQQQRVVKLPPRGKLTFDIGIEIHGDAAGVEQAESFIAELQQGTEPKIYRAPLRGWCADA